jgi:hypothetical protein
LRSFLAPKGLNTSARGNAPGPLLRHDYTPKPGFAIYRRLIAELGSRGPA